MKTFTTVAFAALFSGLVSGSAPRPGKNWTTTLFLDDFTGPAGSAPSTSNWIFQMGTQYDSSEAPPDWGTGEVESYTSNKQNVRLTGDGLLQITPRLSKTTGDWTSSRIETVSDSFQAPVGGQMRVEARVTIPPVTASNGLGYWPAFWALGGGLRSNYSNWPAVGEFDIMENVNGGSTVNQGIHCDVNPGGVCNEPDGLGNASPCSGTACVGNPHVYTMIVDRSVSPEQLYFKVDQVVQKTISETQLGSAVWNQTVHQGIYLILDVAMGGSFPNAVAGFSTPTSATVGGISMLVDYVAVWTTS